MPRVAHKNHVQVPSSQPTESTSVHRIAARMNPRVPARIAPVEVIALKDYDLAGGELQKDTRVGNIGIPPEIQQVPGEHTFELVQNRTLKQRKPPTTPRVR